MKSIQMSFWALSLSLAAGSAYAAESPNGKIYLAGKPVPANVQIVPTADVSLFQVPGLNELSSAAASFVAANKQILGLDTLTSLSEAKVQNGDVLETHRFKKSYKGLEVLGGDAVVQFKGGQIAFASADATPLLNVDTAPRISADDAAKIAFASYRGTAHSAEAPKLLVLGGNNNARLAYAVTVLDRDGMSSDVHYIDAATAQELLVTSNVQTLADRNVLAAGGSEDDFDVVTNTDLGAIDRTFTKVYSTKDCAAPQSCAKEPANVATSALGAWNNSGLVLEYYSVVHGRDSVDAKGLPIRSIVNFGGDAFKNAAWFRDRSVMLYGMGGTDGLNDFASPLDVVAHEITHGVTANTAALQYASESGALNESYSDVFGKLVAFRNGRDSNDWKLGKELFADGKSFVRDMENPKVSNVKDFKYKGQPCNRLNDNCGVHDNSGIPSKAAVAIAKRLGVEKFGKLYFLTLTQLLRSSSDFKDARAQTEAACITLFGKGAADCQAVSEGFASVGIL